MLFLIMEEVNFTIYKKIMMKCDFCTKSSPSGKCFYSSQIAREDDCKKAIEQMTKAFKEIGKENKKNLF